IRSAGCKADGVAWVRGSTGWPGAGGGGGVRTGRGRGRRGVRAVRGCGRGGAGGDGRWAFEEKGEAYSVSVQYPGAHGKGLVGGESERWWARDVGEVGVALVAGIDRGAGSRLKTPGWRRPIGLGGLGAEG
ncbi:MAG: hypothetical protein OXM62_04150, partial [bacterium]|nr:hypothetical protein [bacterium]